MTRRPATASEGLCGRRKEQLQDEEEEAEEEAEAEADEMKARRRRHLRRAWNVDDDTYVEPTGVHASLQDLRRATRHYGLTWMHLDTSWHTWILHVLATVVIPPPLWRSLSCASFGTTQKLPKNLSKRVFGPRQGKVSYLFVFIVFQIGRAHV